jgi:hypothetical protein
MASARRWCDWEPPATTPSASGPALVEAHAPELGHILGVEEAWRLCWPPEARDAKLAGDHLLGATQAFSMRT